MRVLERPYVSIIVLRPSVRFDNVDVININDCSADFFSASVCNNYLRMIINYHNLARVFDSSDIINASIQSHLVVMFATISFTAYVLDATAPRDNTFAHTSTAFQ
jgi:hypothetical protein